MNPTFINTAVYSTNLKLTIYQFVQFIDKPADMKSITHCMMHLDGERKYDFFIISVIFPHRKNRNQIIISFLQIQIKVIEGLPWYHRYIKNISGYIWLSYHSIIASIPLHIIRIRHRKCFKIWYVWCPKVGKCLCILMEYGIAGYNFINFYP